MGGGGASARARIGAGRAHRGRVVKILEADLLLTTSLGSPLPEPGPPEFAFLGRSNVGKSSLLNALVGRKQLARTSSTPGKTRQINFFRIRSDHGEFRLVDLPGYGWARVSQSERRSWQRLVESYLDQRATLRAAILLQDLRRDLPDDESLLPDWLAARSLFRVLVLTQSDKLNPPRRRQRHTGHQLHTESGD